MIALAVEALAASAALMLAVLLVRGPVRRAFGAELAYALWAIPALRLILPPLPPSWRAGVAAPVMDIGHQASAFVVPLVEVTSGDVIPVTTLFDRIAPVILTAWIVGAALFLAWQLVGYARFRLALMRDAVPLDRHDGVAIVESGAATGPLAFGIVRRVVAFPRDFAARYDADERALALAHELGHHRRGDLYANWVALAVLALHWFNPVAWIAYRAFRADQEMANDAGVMARLGAGARHAYGCAIVKAAHGRALTPACHLHTIEDLKGRLRMLARKRASRARMAAGAAAAGLLAAGGLALTASGTQAAERVRAGVETATGVELAALNPATMFEASEAPRPGTGPTRRATRVIVTRDGRTETYEGTAAEAYIAAHPVAVPPVPPVPSHPDLPPVPPVPPMPPAPSIAAMPPVGAVPVIAERHCGPSSQGTRREMVIRRGENGGQVTVICTDRIAAAARAGVEAQHLGMQAREQAMRSAIASLEQSRRGMAADRHLPAEALHGIDEAIAEMRDELRDAAREARDSARDSGRD